jgi:hypothetical protein
MNYATDTDLIHHEPGLFKDTALVSQTLIAGTGDLAGTGFTIDAGSLIAAGVTAGHVLYLGGTINGCFPIIEVTGATTLDLTVLYDLLLADLVPIATAADLPFKVQTATPQIALVSEMIRRVLGVDDDAEILNPAVLRRTTCMGALHMLYNATAAITLDDSVIAAKAAVYRRLFQQSLRSVHVELDRNGDGWTDQVLCPGLPRLVRN